MISKLVILCGLSIVIVNSKPKNWIDMLNDINKKHFGINTHIQNQRRLAASTQSHITHNDAISIMRLQNDKNELLKSRLQNQRQLDHLNSKTDALDYLKYLKNKAETSWMRRVFEPKSQVGEVNSYVKKFFKKWGGDPTNGIYYYKDYQTGGSHGAFVVKFDGSWLTKGACGTGTTFWDYIGSELFGEIIKKVDETKLSQQKQHFKDEIDEINEKIRAIDDALYRRTHGSPVHNKENIGLDQQHIEPSIIPKEDPKTNGMREYMYLKPRYNSKSRFDIFGNALKSKTESPFEIHTTSVNNGMDEPHSQKLQLPINRRTINGESTSKHVPMDTPIHSSIHTSVHTPVDTSVRVSYPSYGKSPLSAYFDDGPSPYGKSPLGRYFDD